MAFAFTPVRRCLRSDEGGTVALIFALVVVAMLTASGVAIDLARAVNEQKAMQAALDTSALAAAKRLENAAATDAEITAAARETFAANIAAASNGLTCVQPSVAINRAAGEVLVSVDCSVPTTLAALMAVEKVDVGASSGAVANLTRLDLALMLDVSGSMAGTKITDLRAAAKEAADILITAESGDRVRMAFNTYSTALNAGVFAPTAVGAAHNGSLNCVSERTGAEAFTAAAPATGQFVGYAANSCPTSQLMPLTADKTAFKAGIDTLTASGQTAGHLGVAWAWYLIAPEWKGVWPTASEPLDYTAPQTVKAVILMTDGMFNKTYAGGQGNSATQAKALCANMRAQGVRVYAVAFQAPASAQAVLQDCAGDPARFFAASTGSDLKDAYRAIASELAGLRLSR